MNKRNVVIATAIAAILGTGAVVAGGKYCDKDGDGHGYHHRGGHHGAMFGGKGMHRMLHHLEDELELTDAQTESLKSIMQARRDGKGDKRSSRRALMQEAMKLDPMATDYDIQVAQLADQVAEMARDMALEMGDMRKQVAEVLTPEQRAEMQSMLEKRMQRMSRHMGGEES